MVFSSFYAVRTTKINLTLSSAWHCQLGAVSSTLITTSNNASLPCEECARRAQCLSIYRRGTSMYYHSCTVASNQQSGLFPFPSRIAVPVQLNIMRSNRRLKRVRNSNSITILTCLVIYCSSIQQQLSISNCITSLVQCSRDGHIA
jgi:hypothetical protein